MCTHNQCFRAKKKNIVIFHLKINSFTAVKYCCILHERICVMVINNLNIIYYVHVHVKLTVS